MLGSRACVGIPLTEGAWWVEVTREENQWEGIKTFRCYSERKCPQQELNLPHQKRWPRPTRGGRIRTFIPSWHRSLSSSQASSETGLPGLGRAPNPAWLASSKLQGFRKLIDPLGWNLIFEWCEIYSPTNCNPEMNHLLSGFFYECAGSFIILLSTAQVNLLRAPLLTSNYWYSAHRVF